MSAVDEIINYQRSADEDLYGLLNCTEQATVSVVVVIVIRLSVGFSSFLVAILQN